jgi:hypothetical protein
LPKLRLVVPPKLTIGAVPVPLSGMLCGLPAALSVIETVADRAPLAVGLKVTVIVQLELAATLAPQVFVCEKSPLFAPVMVMPEPLKESVAFPVLVSVTLCEALLVPTS